MALNRPADQDLVIIGATGDLSARKLLPALYNLHVEGLLPERGDVLGVAPMGWTDDRFRKHAQEAVRSFSRSGFNERQFTGFAERLRFVTIGDEGDLAPLRAAARRPERLVYLAVPSSAFVPLAHGLAAAGLQAGTKLVIEKPFGRDSASATQLNVTLHEVLPEERIYRIDHYLGKETVQNMLVFRFGNSIWERVWHREAISRVEITVAESLGVEHRGRFYEETGAIRDIVQNHMFQLLAVTAMEPPISFEPEALRNEKVKVLEALHPLDPGDVVRGQYAAGTVDGEKVPGYREEEGVGRASQVETFVALRAQIDSWRWAGVPFLLRTGKRLAARETRVDLTFREAPLHLFRGVGLHSIDSNRMVIRIQPDEGIGVTFVAKRPGPEVTTQLVEMDFRYQGSFKVSPPEAYERLLHDALVGDHTLFIREDEVERGWQVVQPVLDNPPPVEMYPSGSWGPAGADRIARPGHWHNL
ncbi:MAG TPA: glucose-6-phosphate dehydrogenase [Candidatus Binatia bacterium]|nr:glucose-6-phosphate dehydrogenase [Candidatus Binatia bacterium]